ncbi:unnamed protein product [Pipistrellus nathusii]|uniref:Galectin n=1 Tax=Pipistrellus nathusii TaxID=59473 RepID=A0ABN9ZHW9_PIPNA
MSLLPIPYTKHARLPVGSFVKIKGTPAMPFSMDSQMQVDFHTGNENISDIAFHFRVFYGRRVVMNTRQGGKWGEEVKLNAVPPFEDEQPFDLTILVQSDAYQVSVNGREYYKFPHRLEPGTVKMIQVWREVSLTSVTVA